MVAVQNATLLKRKVSQDYHLRKMKLVQFKAFVTSLEIYSCEKEERKHSHLSFGSNKKKIYK